MIYYYQYSLFYYIFGVFFLVKSKPFFFHVTYMYVGEKEDRDYCRPPDPGFVIMPCSFTAKAQVVKPVLCLTTLTLKQVKIKPVCGGCESRLEGVYYIGMPIVDKVAHL